MRALLKIAIVAALAFLYYRWPSSVAGKFETALAANDREALREMMDIEGLRKAMGREWYSTWEKVFSTDDPRAAAEIRKALVANPADGFDADILEKAFPEERVLDVILDRGRSLWDDGKWESATAYSLTNHSNGTKFTFYFRLTKWKLAGMEVTFAQARNVVRK